MKQNSFLDRIQRQNEEHARWLVKLTERFMCQLVFDMFSLEMRRHGISKERARQICEAANDDMAEFATKWQTEISSKKDPDKKSGCRMELQRALEREYGDMCMPWEERYKGLEDAWNLCYVERLM